MEWALDLKAALADAKKTQRLVLVCFNMDGEQANERALAMYRSDEFAKAVANVICVLCSKDKHGDGTAPCPRFATSTCVEHCRNEREARRHFFGDSSDELAPQHILLFPDGLVAWHAIYDVVPVDICKAIDVASKQKDQPLAQRLRAQRVFIEQARGRAEKNVPTAYMQVQARLVQTPAEHFAEAVSVLNKALTDRLLRDLEGYTRERALPLLRACDHHPTKATRELALALAAKVEKHEEVAVAEAAPAVRGATLPPPLIAALPVLGTADDMERVNWLEAPQSPQTCRGHITVLWFFLFGAKDLAEQVAAMNEFALTNASLGVNTLGLVCNLRPSEAGEKLASLGCRFPLGVYQGTTSNKLFGVTMFPSWIVLDPEANVVHCSRQDGKGFDWAEARELAARMAVSPIYTGLLSTARLVR